MKFNINPTENSSGKVFRVEFQHTNRHTARGHKRLNYFTGFDAMTTCVVVEGERIAIHTTFCSTSDYNNPDPDQRFSYERARVLALKGALDKYKGWRKDIPSILKAYRERRMANQVNLPVPPLLSDKYGNDVVPEVGRTYQGL